jgi:oligopeptide transport system permease protein
MGSYALKRLGLMLVTLSIIIFLVFYIIKLMPDAIREPNLGGNVDVYDFVRIREGYDKPIVEQFFIWLRNIVVDGTFGYSFYQNRDVALVLAARIPVSVRINIIPFLISIPIGITLGMLAALKKNKFTDHAISFGIMIFISVPSFVVAVLLQFFIVYRWGLLQDAFVLPADLSALDPVRAATSRILPILVLTVGGVAGWARGIRAELTEVLTSEFILLARSKGLTRRQATVRHAFRNALVPFAPALVGGFVGLLSGSLIIEGTFGIAGVGGIYLRAFSDRDFPMLMMVVLFYTSIGLTAAILGDLSYGFIDPRIKMGAKKS